MRRRPYLVLTVAVLLASVGAIRVSGAESSAKPKAPGLGDPGKLMGLEIIAGGEHACAARRR